MIPSREELMRSVFAAWRLLHYDRAAPYYFNLGVDGLRHSFIAPLAMMPLWLLSVLLARLQLDPPDFNLFGEAAGYVLFFTLWPLLMIPVARAARLTAHYVPYVIAYNWSTVVIMVFMLPAAVAQAAQAEPGGFGDVIYLTISIASLAYQFMIARLAFRAPIPLALGLVALDFSISLSIGRGVTYLFY